MNPLFFILLFSLIISGSNSTTNSTVPVDCVPDSYILGIKTEEVCSQRGCIYNPHVPSGPFCTFPQNYGYKLASKTRTKVGWSLTLKRDDTLKSLFGNDSNSLTAHFIFQSEYMIRIKITDNSERYEVPLKLDLPTKSSNKHLYDVNFIDSPIFGFEIIRVSSQRVILSTRNMPGLIFSNQFIQLPLSLNEKVDMYGLGENEQASLRHDMSWKFWNGWARDSTPNGFGNLYGVFPLMTALEPEGTASTIVFLNSNAQEWVTNPPNKFIYRTIGGLLDTFIFLGPSPEESLAQYASTFGKYEIPPYWSLGHHLCRYGYKSTEAIRQAYRRTLKYNIPLDVQWADIDYMDRFMDFTIDPVHFKDLPDFVKEIHGDGKHFVPILDPGIDFESKGMDGGTYVPYELGQKMNVWVKRSDGSPMVGKVWPYGKVHFPDFFKRNTTIWWELCVKDFHSKMEIDGIWIDMNEPSNFADGDVDKGCAANALNNPPYLPRNLQGSKIAAKTICSDHTQVLDEKVVPHYDLHSLYGLSEARATIRALRLATKTRGFVLSRSTYLGSGRYTAKWLGDNKSLWSHLKESIIGIIQFNMFGIPHVGADICGFIGETTPELCLRWYQVGSFYPFSRNHNSIGFKDQDPGSFGPKVAFNIRHALRLRYNLLPYLYTLFYNHRIYGSTVVRAMWNVFPRDLTCRGLDEQFMWGDGLLIAPVVAKGHTHKSVFFPGDGNRWYDFSYYLHTGTIAEVPKVFIGKTSQVVAPLEIVPLFIRGGFILPLQADAMDTTKSRHNDFSLEVALNSRQEAEGKLFYDDGYSEGTLEAQEYYLARFIYDPQSSTLESQVLMRGYPPMKNLKLSFVGISGLEAKSIHYIVVNNSTVIGDYDYLNGRLAIRNLSLRMNEAFSITLHEGQ